jgi:hypothetical protein
MLFQNAAALFKLDLQPARLGLKSLLRGF